MYVRRNIKWNIIFRFAWKKVIIFIVWSTAITMLYVFCKKIGYDISIPFLPISTIGIAVAFYIGFKNSQSYDRFWEGRKIWGGIVNYSRTWANQVISHIGLLHQSEGIDETKLQQIRKRLIYRHMAYINALRIQLRATTIHDRKNLSFTPDFKLSNDRECKECVLWFLDKAEYDFIIQKANGATHLLRNQADELANFRKLGMVDGFQHTELMRNIEVFYELQGKCERIKNTPFPRQYAYFSSLFVNIFNFLLPIGLVGLFGDAKHEVLVWLNVPFSVLVCWIFYTMEAVGDNSEDPFENYVNDVPMSAICRTIEIDLMQMLGEKDIPEKIKPVNDVLL